MFNMMNDIEMCTNQSKRVLQALKTNWLLNAKGFIADGTIILPESTNSHCFKIKMPVGTNELIVSFAFAPDRQDNRGTSAKNPPSTMELFLQNVPDEFYTALGYNGDICSFKWERLDAEDDGCEKIIDELIRIRNIINPQVTNNIGDDKIMSLLCECNDSILEIKSEKNTLQKAFEKNDEAEKRMEAKKKRLLEFPIRNTEVISLQHDINDFILELKKDIEKIDELEKRLEGMKKHIIESLGIGRVKLPFVKNQTVHPIGPVKKY